MPLITFRQFLNRAQIGTKKANESQEDQKCDEMALTTHVGLTHGGFGLSVVVLSEWRPVL